MMTETWNSLAGELRSALAARDWHQAGAIVWQLRQLDPERYKSEVERYTNQQVGQGRRSMALETEQRAEAVRQWARLGVEEAPLEWDVVLRALLKVREPNAQDLPRLLGQAYGNIRLNDSFDIHHINTGQLLAHGRCLDWEVGQYGNVVLRADLRDVLWSVLLELEALLKSRRGNEEETR
jgi:hypothetical protein